jgi:F-type H+-transporting ATPase subunit gamma
LLGVESEQPDGPTVAIVFGSDHGLCGRFNEQISRFARTEMRERSLVAGDGSYLAVGVQAASRLEAMGEEISECFYLPGAVSGLTATAHSVLLKIDEWQAAQGIARVLLFHNARSAEAMASPVVRQLLPIDPDWLRSLAKRRWPSRVLPTYTMDSRTLFSSLIQEHLFVTIFRAGAESMASEHATRLASMQAAERNIQEHLEEMTGAFRRRRQQAITEELLDVVAGFETLRTSEESLRA